MTTMALVVLYKYLLGNRTEVKLTLDGLFLDLINGFKIYTTLANFGIIYLVMCKVYTDIGGIH